MACDLKRLESRQSQLDSTTSILRELGQTGANLKNCLGRQELLLGVGAARYQFGRLICCVLDRNLSPRSPFADLVDDDAMGDAPQVGRRQRCVLSIEDLGQPHPSGLKQVLALLGQPTRARLQDRRGQSTAEAEHVRRRLRFSVDRFALCSHRRALLSAPPKGGYTAIGGSRRRGIDNLESALQEHVLSSSEA
jgi:hypothetical protein